MRNPFLLFLCYLLTTALSILRVDAQTLFLSGTDVSIKKNGTPTPLTAEALKQIVVKKGLKFDASGIPTGSTLKIESGAGANITDNTDQFTHVSNQYTFTGKDKTIKILKVTITPSSGAPKVFDNIGADVAPAPPMGTNVASSYTSWRDFLAKNRGGVLDIIKGRQRYFSASNRAYICLDPFGNIIGKKPVNIDQDDDITIVMIVPESEDFDNYSVNDNDAEYAPSDLSIRPMEAIASGSIQSGDIADVGYAIKLFEKGPYTNSDVTFTIMNGNTMLNNITIHINPLYHLGLGVSYLSSNLESPDYQVIPLNSTTNTIQSINGGNRTFLTINAIWYWWSTIRYIGGSSITRGRDVLKEPNLLTRINPTFGVALKGNIENNFFLGANFEFARGGSISAGWHYGKVTQLVDQNFQLGVSTFSGMQSDIKIEERWKWGGFFGITLDTRIFNKLFSTSKSTN